MVLNANHVLEFIPSGVGQFGAKAQCGVDLSVCGIKRIKGGKITQNGKEIDKYEEVPSYISKEGIKTWILKKGVYSLEFDQDIKLDNKHSGMVIGRSTTNRLGCLIRSSWFDAGFTCPSIGATLYVLGDNQVKVEEHSRLAQLILFDTEESEAYNGNYQGEKDIK